VDAPDARNAVIEHKKSKCFPEEDHQTLIFSSQITYTCWGNGAGGKIGASEAIQKRLEWENLIFFAGYYILSIHDSQLHVSNSFCGWFGETNLCQNLRATRFKIWGDTSYM
jgi:hypothetical protein